MISRKRQKPDEPPPVARLYARMITNDEKALLVLNNLIRAGRDAEQGFLAAADSVPEPDLVQIFADLALRRAKFELRSSARRE